MTSTAQPAPSRTARVTVVRRIVAVVAATFAMLFGFALASSASPAHADTVTGDASFSSTVECGGDSLLFTVNSDSSYGSFAQVWVYDTATEQWVTDSNWVDANADASFNVADLTFEPGYYMVYVAYAQWNGYDFDYSGEYIDTYEQYYTYSDHAASNYCYQGNDLTNY